jgi:hypothetical protein
MVAAACRGEKALIIGFAETATALGAAVASAVDNAVYVHTTREIMPPDLLRANFTEEHSHAREQALFLAGELADLSAYGCLVLVEDEITTGKTMLNLLKVINFHGRIIIAALVFNGLNEKVFSAYNAEVCFLQKIGCTETLFFAGFPNPRLGVAAAAYLEKCHQLAQWFIEKADLPALENKRVLVVGTEEFMYPALILGQRLEGIAQSVFTHSTTRSPLLPGDKSNYPLHSRAAFNSMYDSGRINYLYNLARYDTVIIVSDGGGGAGGLIDALRATVCEKIYLVRVNNGS